MIIYFNNYTWLSFLCQSINYKFINIFIKKIHTKKSSIKPFLDNFPHIFFLSLLIKVCDHLGTRPWCYFMVIVHPFINIFFSHKSTSILVNWISNHIKYIKVALFLTFIQFPCVHVYVPYVYVIAWSVVHICNKKSFQLTFMIYMYINVLFFMLSKKLLLSFQLEL